MLSLFTLFIPFFCFSFVSSLKKMHYFIYFPHTDTHPHIHTLQGYYFTIKLVRRTFGSLKCFCEHQDANDSYSTSDIKQNQCGRLIKELLDTLRHISLCILSCQSLQMRIIPFNADFLTFRCQRQGIERVQKRTHFKQVFVRGE